MRLASLARHVVRGELSPHGILLGHAARHPDALALACPDADWTYAQLAERVGQAAAALTRRFAPGIRVGIATSDHSDAVIALAAAMSAGLVAVAVGPRIADADRDELVRDAGVNAVLSAHEISAAPPGSASRRFGGGGVVVSTSGTTGRPRLPARRRLTSAHLHQLWRLERAISWPRGPVCVAAPLDHGHGLSAVFSGLWRGETVVLAGDGRHPQLAPLLGRVPVRAVTGVPVLLSRVIPALSEVQLVVSGSAHLSDQVAAAWKVPVRDLVGCTETGTFAMRTVPGVFRVLPGAQVRIAADGALSVRTALSGKRWVDTGDLAERRDDGFVLRGRRGALVDAGGELRSPERIREAILSVPGVRACTVEVREDDLRGILLTAQVTARLVSEQALRSAILPVLGAAGMPHRLVMSPVAGPGEPG